MQANTILDSNLFEMCAFIFVIYNSAVLLPPNHPLQTPNAKKNQSDNKT